eukprot:scaffold14815_cov53-Phaeocystis_antarctica.AAC.5
MAWTLVLLVTSSAKANVGIAESRGREGVGNGNPPGDSHLDGVARAPGSARGRGSPTPRQGRARGRSTLPGGGERLTFVPF